MNADCEPFRPGLPLCVPQILPFHVVGVSHHTATVEERERFAFTRADTLALLESQRQAGRSALLLSTCNRCELYWSGDGEGEAWFRVLAQSRGVAPPASSPAMTASRQSAISSLSQQGSTLRFWERPRFSAKCAGHMMPPGQPVRRPARWTRSSRGACGRAAGPPGDPARPPSASVSSAAVDLIAERWGNIGARAVVVLGAGEAAEGVLRALQERGASNVRLLSRHPERARVLAHAWGAEVGGWDELEPRLEHADLLLVATASSRPVITAAQLAARSGELFVIDLAVPRNVEPGARHLPRVQLLILTICSGSAVRLRVPPPLRWPKQSE